jgi:sugar lactone lactonase YvrE
MATSNRQRGKVRPKAARRIPPPHHRARPTLEALEDRQCPTTVSVYASGLFNPRGLTFGPDGNLYVAEGGSGGISSTVGQCDQVAPPVGPYAGGYTSRISKITSDGMRTTVADNLPSSQTSPMLGNLVSGVAAVQFIGDTLYGIEAGAGCSHGLAGTDNTIFRVNADGSTTTIADLSVFQQANPTIGPDGQPASAQTLDDFEPDGTWYSMVAVRGALYAVEPNHGELDRITTDGQISRVADIYSTQGHVVPTALAYHGNFYVGNLGTFPVTPGTENVYKITPSGQIKVFASGLTTVTGVAFDPQGQMYVLETDTAPGFPGPSAAGSGMVVRVNDDGSLTTIASGLVFPTAMTFGPDGALYLSNFGFGAPPIGLGQILRVDLGPTVAADSSVARAGSILPASSVHVDLAQATDMMIQPHSKAQAVSFPTPNAPAGETRNWPLEPVVNTTTGTHSAAVDSFFIQHAGAEPAQLTTNLGEVEL